MNKKLFFSIFIVSVIIIFICLLFTTLSIFSSANKPILFSVSTFAPAFVLSILSALILSFFISRRISKNILKSINSSDLSTSSLFCKEYPEFTSFFSKIATQKRATDRKLKEAERRQEEFRLITENMSEGFLTVDEVGNILTYNNAALSLLKLEVSDIGNILNLNQTKQFRDLIYTALDGERAEDEITIDSQTYNLIANPVFDENKLIGAIIIVLDVTESFRREQLRREFTSNVSHELKTPLTSISGFAEIMKYGATDSETVIDFSKSIYDEAQRLITLVSDIIKLTELDEGSIEFDKTNVDLLALSKEIITRLEPAAKPLDITLKCSGESAMIFGSEKILDEMIFNLCDNAIKYNVQGGFAEIDIRNSENVVILTVSDSGIGIPQEEQSRVFERFYRVDKSHSKEVGGTGLGLSIVKHGAIYHNAQISLESTLNKGTKITVTFNS